MPNISHSIVHSSAIRCLCWYADTKGSFNKGRPFRHTPKNDAETSKLIDTVRGKSTPKQRARATDAITHIEELETVSKVR